MTIHALGPFHLDTQDNLLLRGGEPVALGRRAVALLRALIERQGALVSKDALIEAAWPGQAIEESNLTVQIAALRRVLGEAPGGDRWIETMPRRGYRLVGPVVTAGEPGVAPPPRIEAMQAPAPRAEAERRQITAMSCELIGVPARADGAGLEDLRDAISVFQRCVARTVDRHHGIVVSRLGNSVLVLFGYPTAHEHDAELAVRAGLALCTAVGALSTGRPMQCRVGIATGMAIIGDLGRDGEIVGDAPNLAARLQHSAAPNTVAIEPATRQLIGTLFEYRDLGTIDGNAPPRIWQVTGERAETSRFEALRGPVLSRLVGRDEEIDLLLRRWARATAGDGQVALISGEAGLGKSRLAASLQERLHDEPCLLLRYACSPSHQDSALFPFADQLRRAAGLGRDDPPAVGLDKLAAWLARAALPGEDVALLADLLSLPPSARHPLTDLDPRKRKARTLAALLRHLEGLARQQPVFMVVEDAHWIDATSGELLDRIVERTRYLPLLLLVTFRPEFQPPWIGQPGVTMLALNRLDRRERIALATQIAGKTLPDTVIDQIADRTDGVPLFVEELTKSVLESGLLRPEADRYVLDAEAPPFAIPTTLYASLLARLDRPAAARAVAQTGAAIGREFPYALLRTVCRMPEDELQSALASLVAAELIFPRGTPPDAIYSFKHALVQDVAHGSLLQDARRRAHAAIAEALAAQSPDLLEAQPELFAQHYAEAGQAENSAAAWGRAGRRSAARSALAEAAAQFQKALDQVALLPDGPDRLRQELDFRSALGALLRFVKGQAAPETGQAYARASTLWAQLGHPSGFLQVPYGQSMYHLFRGEVAMARRVGDTLLQLSAERQDSAGLVLGHSACGQGALLAGDFAAAREHLEQVLALHDPAAHAPLVQQTGSHPLMTQAFLGIVLLCLGFPDQARARGMAAIADARRLAHPASMAVSLVIGALQLSLIGDSAALTERAERLNAVATEQGFPAYRAWAVIYRGWAKVRAGEVTDGIALLSDGLAAYRSTGAEMWMPRFIALLAAAHEIAGQLDQAATLLDDAFGTVERTGERWFAAELHRQKGQLLRRQGQSKAAEEQYRQALGIARAQQARLWELRAATDLARLRRDARSMLAPVRDWFTEGFDLPDLEDATALL